MYLTIDQVILISNKNKLQADDVVVYERDLDRVGRVFTTDGGPCKYAGEAKAYGHIYFDTSDNTCIIPAVWNEEDALAAKDWR